MRKYQSEATVRSFLLMVFIPAFGKVGFISGNSIGVSCFCISFHLLIASTSCFALILSHFSQFLSCFGVCLGLDVYKRQVQRLSVHFHIILLILTIVLSASISYGLIFLSLIHIYMKPEERREAYNCDITYVTNNELGFDYLRDNMVIYKEQLVQRDLHYCIIDERCV